MSSSWILLVLAGLAEIAFAIGLKFTEGFSKPLPTVLTIIAMLISLFFLSRASLHIPIGTAYSVWVGIGAIGACVLGAILFQESLTFLRVFFLILLLVAIVGLKVTNP
jgi:quaternary ammonium compound-resistance protein SugE